MWLTMGLPLCPSCLWRPQVGVFLGNFSFCSPVLACYHPNACTGSRALCLLAGLCGGGSHRNTTSDLPGLQTNEKFISSC